MISEVMKWILLPVFIITLCISPFNVAGQNKSGNLPTAPPTSTIGSGNQNTLCDILHPLMYGIIIFLATLVLILLILIYKIFSMQNCIRRDNVTSEMEESTVLSPNNALSVSPSSCDGADSSSTSSGTPEGSLEDLSSASQRYVCLQDRLKASDYINVSESASSGRPDKKTDIDYVNVKESKQKINIRGRVRCDNGTSISSDGSNESTLNYSTVVFTTK